MKNLFEIIFWVLLYQLNKLCLPGNLNECAEASPYTLYKTIFQVGLSYWLDQL